MKKNVLSILDWRITYDCDNKCQYCFGTKEVDRINIFEEAIIIDKLISFPSEVINITGGEPLLDYCRCFHIIKKIVSAGKKVYLSTNGTNLKSNLSFISENVSLLGLPIDGYDEESSYLNGRSKISFRNIIDVLCNLKNFKKRPKIKIGTVITKKNCNKDFLNNVFHLLTNYNIDIWRIYEVLPVNRGAYNKSILELDNNDRKMLIDYVNELKNNNPNFKIELVTREMRNSSYFIIQPDGSVILPKDDGIISEEIVVGNLINECIETVYDRWEKMIDGSKIIDYEITRKLDVED